MRRLLVITLALLWALAAAVTACDDGSTSDGDGDGDTDGDGDGDGDAGPADCPRNSGWPCTCDRRDGCDDGSACAAAPGMTEGLGVCAALCDTSAPDAHQCPDTDFSGMGFCRISSSPWGDPTHCLMACGHWGNCPSDQRCVDLGISDEVDFCAP